MPPGLAAAGCSHSASVGSRRPAHRAYASASCQQTWLTGSSGRRGSPRAEPRRPPTLSARPQRLPRSEPPALPPLSGTAPEQRVLDVLPLSEGPACVGPVLAIPVSTVV